MMAPLLRRTWNPRGETPSLRHCGCTHRKVSVIGALCVAPDRSDVRLYFRLHPNANINAERAFDFGGCVGADCTRSICPTSERP